MVKNNLLLEDGAKRLLSDLRISIRQLVGVEKLEIMITGTIIKEEMMTQEEETLLLDLKDHTEEMIKEEEEALAEEEVEELEVHQVVAEAQENASSVTRKVTWLENVLMLHRTMTGEEEEAEEVVEETASFATKKVIWLENVQTKIVQTEEEAVEEAEEEMETTKVVVVAVALELALNVGKRVTLQENAQIHLKTLVRDLTRDKGEMKMVDQ